MFSKSLQTLFTEVIYLCRPGDPTKTKWYTFFSCCCINHLRENNCWNMLREVIKQKEKSRSCSSVATTFVSKTDAANSGLIYLESLTNIFCLLSTANVCRGNQYNVKSCIFENICTVHCTGWLYKRKNWGHAPLWQQRLFPRLMPQTKG